MQKEQYEDVSQPVNEIVDLVYNHFGKIPMGWTEVDKLVEYAHNEQFVNRVLKFYYYLLSSENLITTINPSQYYKIIYKFQLASKSLHYDVNLLVNCYLYLANYAVKIYNFNIRQIECFLSLHSLIPIKDDEIKHNILFLSALLRSFSETVYCDEHTIAGEIYCPIESEKGFVIVRKYHMLNAQELYPELNSCKFQGINIYIEYGKISKEVNTDIVGNLLINENISSFIKSYYVEKVDLGGKVSFVGDTEIKELIDFLKFIIPMLVTKLKSMSISERLWKKIECEYYAFKPLLDTIGEDWVPQKYDISIEKISDSRRPIVYLNNMIKVSDDEREIKEILFDLNNPRLHIY